jgi:hypothetical protein
MIDGSILAGLVRLQRNDFRILTSLVGNGKVRVLFREPSEAKE